MGIENAPRRGLAVGPPGCGPLPVRLAILQPCLLALAALVAAPACADPGWDAHRQGRYEAAVAMWREAAERGDAEAQFGLGVAYDLGQGVPADAALSCAWHTRAAEAGHVEGAFKLAVLHDSGRCGPRRADVAARWYARAAAADFSRAQAALGRLYAAGDGVPRNPDQAAAWYRAAAANGMPDAADRPIQRPARPRRGPLLPVAPTDPDGFRPLPGGDAPIALAWEAPAQPSPTRFFVEIVALEPSGPREVVGRYVDVSATLVQLPSTPARYAWRVLSVSAAPASYAVGPWRGFVVGAGRP